MAIGLYRNKVRDGSEYAGVDYGGEPKEIPKERYIMRAIQPPYEQLPTKAEYEAKKNA